MYHVKHIVEGDKHVLLFRSVTLPGGKQFPMWEGKEVARVECRIARAEKSVRNTKAILARTLSDERLLQEIQIAGEKVRHVLVINTPGI
jgi:hypothetical protein